MSLRVRSAVVAALFAAVVVAVALPSAARAQDKELVEKAKATAVANLKKAGIEKPTAVETNNYLVVGSMSEEKAKTLGEVLEKTTALARKTLKYEEKDTAWKGKLVVYLMPEIKEYQALMRRAMLGDPTDNTHADLRADPPFLADSVKVGGKPTDEDLYANTAARVAGELLKAKGTGTQNVPEWLRDGFGRATAMRAEGATSKRYTAYRAQAKVAIYGTKGGKVPALADVWGDAKITGGDVLATSFADYLAYGPGAAKFPMFIDGLKPSEGNATPTVPQGLEAAGWKPADLPMLEAAWRKWVFAGK